MKSAHSDPTDPRSPRSGSAAWGCRLSTAHRRRRGAAHDPARAGAGVQLPRHLRHVRAAHQRGTRRPRDRGPARARSCSRPSSASSIGRRDPPRRSDRRQPRVRAHRLRGLAASGSASTTSTSTTSTASTPNADRGDRRRDGRAGAAGQGALPRPLRGARRDDPPRARRAPDHRRAERVLAVDARRRGGGPADADELGIGLVAYSPLGRGFLSGRFTSPEELDEGDFRRYGPRFTGENLQENLKLAERVKEIAAEKGITPGAAGARVGARPRGAHRADPRHQAPVLPRGEPRRGRRRAEPTRRSQRIADELPPAAGDRYDAAGMRAVNI